MMGLVIRRGSGRERETTSAHDQQRSVATEIEGLLPQIDVAWVSAASLKPSPRNPRRHSKKQIAQIAASIRTFGFLVPVLVDEQGEVIAGHGRCLAAEQLGLAEVPVIRVAHLTAEQ